MTFGRQQAALQDLEYSIRQLTEVAVRALSPGINDPFTAGSVVERFGDALCRISDRHLPTGVTEIDGVIRVQRPVTDYAGLCDTMLHTIRQNGAASAYVLIRMLDVLTQIVQVERFTDRRAELSRHAHLVFAAGKDNIKDAAAQTDLARRMEEFQKALATA